MNFGNFRTQMSLEAAQNGSSRQTSAISGRRSSFASASLARLPPHTSKSSPGDVREAGGQRCRTSPRCREATSRHGRVCLRFSSTAAPFTTPPRLKLSASSHARRANVYAVTHVHACGRGLSTKRPSVHNDHSGGNGPTLAEAPPPQRQEPSFAANAGAGADRTGG